MNRQKQHSCFTAGYACIQSSYWLSFSAVMGFTSLYLLDVGFTNTEIGIIIAIAGIISAILQPMFAGYADKPKSPSLKKIILFLASLLLILSLALFLLYRRSVFFNGLFYGGCITLLQLLQPLINSLGMEVVNQGKKLNFGISRGIGSIAYAVAAYFLGLIVAKSGAGAIPISMIVTFATVFFFTLRFSFQKGTHTESSANHEKTGNPFIFFKKYPRFAVTLIGCWLIYVSHILLNSFTFQIVENIGGGSSEMGFSMALAAILELPTMFLFFQNAEKSTLRHLVSDFRYFLYVKNTWHFACPIYSCFLCSTDFPDVWMGAYYCILCLLCKCHYEKRGRHQRTGIYYHDLYLRKRPRLFNRRCTY